MIDGSHSVFEENIAITKSVVDACHPTNVPVEAELGKVGGKECIRRGICKVNYATDLRIAFTNGVKQVLAEKPDTLIQRNTMKLVTIKIDMLPSR